VEDLTLVFRFKISPVPIVERDEYLVAVDRLRKAGYRIKQDGDNWKVFSELRSRYASMLNQMVHLLAMPAAAWVGDRSYLPHRQRRSLRPRRRKPTMSDP
ncbi:MAG TPA: hypothetical protein VET26_08580, partial [Candidatus Sulfotelmatobacter sp.]|nr:hypothetical protein [Candidatus Sulfotelmatobacter sp.]